MINATYGRDRGFAEIAAAVPNGTIGACGAPRTSLRMILDTIRRLWVRKTTPDVASGATRASVPNMEAEWHRVPNGDFDETVNFVSKRAYNGKPERAITGKSND